LTTTDALGDDGYNSSGAYCELPDSDYTQSFRGTSGAAPIVSGVVALMLQANPSLGWRDVKEILLRSARKVEPQDPDWHTNSAGIAHNYRFGAGLVSAAGAITLATNWLNLRPLCVVSLLQTNLGVPVPDNTPVGIERLFAVTNAGFRVETIALTVTLPHNRYGDLAITLTSPAGTVSRLAEPHTSYGTGYGGWTFTSVRHWGEQAQGQWKVNIADRTAGFTGTLQDLRLELLGSVPMAILSLTLTNAEPCLTLTSAAPGWRYILESSTNLLQWSPIATMEIDFAGTCRFSDARTITSAAYYRAALAPEGTVNAAGAGRRPW
jgi:subtilisin-like proprotein convertase family protein